MRAALCFSILVWAFSAGAEDYSNLIGPAVRSRPAYDGSASQRADIVPLLDYEKGHLFARTVQGVLEAGTRTNVGSGLKLGYQLAYEEGRKKSESGFLRERNEPDIGVGASIGLHAEWNFKLGPAPVILLGRWRQQLQTDRGSQTDARATVGVFESGAFKAGVFGQATWATQRAVRTYYGTGGFQPSGGPLFASGGVLASYDVGRRWSIIASAERRRLQGDAARSPLVERKSNTYATAGIAYLF